MSRVTLTDGELDYLIDFELGILARRSKVETGQDAPRRIPVDPARRAYWRRRVVDRARARGLEAFAIYRGGRAQSLDVFLIRQKGATT
jgi:hypothetical protein